MFKKVLKPRDVVGITFHNGSLEKELARIVSCQTTEDSPGWTAILSIEGEQEDRVEGRGIIEAEAIENAIVVAMRSNNFATGKIGDRTFTETEATSEYIVIVQ